MSLDARARRAAQAARDNIDRRPPPPAIGVLVARQRRRVAAINALGLALIVAVGGVAWRALPIGRQQPAATGLPRQVEAAIRVGKAPGAVVVERSQVWVANSGDATVSRIEPSTNQVIALIDVGERPTHIAADAIADAGAGAYAGTVWVTTPKNMQDIDPDSNSVIKSYPLPGGPGDVALAFDGALWVSLNDGTVRKLDPSDGREVASVSVASRGLSMLAIGEDRVWAANRGTLVAMNSLHPQMNTRFTLRWDGNRTPEVTDLVVVGGQIWAADSDGAVVRFPVDPSQRELQGQLVARGGPFAIAAGPTGMALDGVALASRSTHTVMWCDPATGQEKARIRLPDVSDVAVGTTAVWASDGRRGLLYRIDPNATG
jgi:YVTN family beta-propeller protein